VDVSRGEDLVVVREQTGSWEQTMKRSSSGSSSTGSPAAAVSSLSEPRARKPRLSAEAGQKRAVAYIRESTEEQGRGYSPEGQRQAIARYASEQGLVLLEEYLDFESGRAAAKRTGFQRRACAFFCVSVGGLVGDAVSEVDAEDCLGLCPVEAFAP